MSPAYKRQILQDRAAMLAKARSFFASKSILEVDTPILSHSAPIDEHIDVMTVSINNQEQGYLHTSPEYAMKRLLSMGMPDIYQLGHVFRAGEYSKRHNPEFTMAEWYRIGMSFSSFIEETLEFIHLFLGELPSSSLSYKDAFSRYTGIDPFDASEQELLAYLISQGTDLASSDCDKDALLSLILGTYIEPHLGDQELTVLTDYPSSQAALARTYDKEEITVAARFEVYYQGVELANGYHELTNAQEQRARLKEANEKRALQGKPTLPLDEHFLLALESGLPDCCGVAVGFDRLMQLKHQATCLGNILPFSWDSI